MTVYLEKVLPNCLAERVAAVGIGNVDLGDDGFGVRMAERLMEAGYPDSHVAATMPERWMLQLMKNPVDHVIFLDALELRAEPGSAAFLSAEEVTSLFPQVSTHKISLGTLAELIASEWHARVWLLGVQPKTLAGSELSPEIEASLQHLTRIWMNAYQGNVDDA